MMGRAAGAALLILSLVLTGPAQGAHYATPGKPKLTSCRSPEKETFTCWWEPGSDGGLPTTYALYYRKESSETVYECPDYHTAGENSCFFNKNDTSIWINYNITVVATNALGSNFSDPANVDVVYIVQPHTPENVTAAVIEDKDGPFLRVSWEPPRKADTRSGWITLIYELRVKLEGEEGWEEHHAGQQKMFNIFSLRSGGAYLVQVRCRPDHGFWSEWSAPTYIKVPNYIPREKSMWILIASFSAFIFLVLAWILHMKSHSVKHCILPPVPGPKIIGFDKQLLKNGRSEDVFNALVVPGFPPTILFDYEDLLVENLEVYIPEEQGLILEESKDLQEGCLKAKGSPSDSDSGRGSCDSHTLLMEKCGEGEAKEDGGEAEEEGGNRRAKGRQQAGWEEGEVSQAQDEMVSPALSDGRVKTWPSVFSPLSQYSSRPLGQQGSLETTKQLCLSDSLFPPPSAVSHPAQLRYSAKEGLAVGPGLGEFCLGKKQPQQLPFQHHWHLQAHSEFDIPSMEHKRAAAGLHLPRSMEYVEVEKVNQEKLVLLQPLSPGHGRRGAGHPQISQGEDYSKVKGVDIDNVLLLQREVKVVDEEGDRCPCDNQETSNGVTESCYTAVTSPTPTVATTWMSGKPTGCAPTTAMPGQEGMVMAANGYVETATMLPAF